MAIAFVHTLHFAWINDDEEQDIKSNGSDHIEFVILLCSAYTWPFTDVFILPPPFWFYQGKKERRVLLYHTTTWMANKNGKKCYALLPMIALFQ